MVSTKMKNQSLFTHTHVVPSLYDDLSIVEHKRRSFEKWSVFCCCCRLFLFVHVFDTIDFHCTKSSFVSWHKDEWPMTFFSFLVK